MVAAVTRAGHLCESVRKTLLPESARTKDDRSPVTVADRGAQAVVRNALSENFADVPVLGEEDASMLGDPAFAKIVAEAVALGGVRMDLDAIRRALEPDEGAATASRRFVLDPVEALAALTAAALVALRAPALEGARSEAFLSFQMRSPEDELVREFGGAMLGLLWSLVLLFRRIRARRSGLAS